MPSGLMRNALLLAAGTLLGHGAALADPAPASNPAPAASSAPTAQAATRIVTLGTGGGPVVRMNRSQTATALVINGRTYLIDVGYGAVRQMAAAGLPLNTVEAVFITHHHIDHTADLSALLALRWVFQGFDPLVVAGPPGTVREVTRLVDAHYETEIARTNNGPLPPKMAKIYSAKDFPSATPAPVPVYADKNVKVFAITNTHYHFPAGSVFAQHARSYSLRIETADGVVAFTGDTGPSKNTETIARNADILVTEIIDLDQTQKQLEGWNLDPVNFNALMDHMRDEHLTAAQVGKLAQAAGVKKVVLSHIAPGLPTAEGDADLLNGVKAVFDGPVNLANDLDSFTLK